jgi:hypothetical protein
MNLGLRRAAERHKALFLTYLGEVGEPVAVRQPAPKPTNPTTDVSKILGSRPAPPAPGQPAVGAVKTVPAIVSGASNIAGNPQPNRTDASVLPVGLLAVSDTVLRVLLDDVLLDPAKRYGKTLFDTAHDVVIHGTSFKVQGSERSGLAPLGPYILWVALAVQN